jgi:paired amphipathic helix protein Sin3a
MDRNRALVSEEEETEDLDLSPGLEVKVRSGEYRLLFVANTEDYLYRRRPIEATSSSSSSSAKGKGRAEQDDAAEEGEVNELARTGGDKMNEDGVDAGEGEVSVRRQRKERFAQWLDDRTGFGRIVPRAGEGGLAASLPPLPLPYIPVPGSVLPPLDTPEPVVTQQEEGEVVEGGDVEMSDA